MITRHSLTGAIALIAGLAIAAALTWSVSQIATERIGLDAAPPSVASGLAPHPLHDRAVTHHRAVPSRIIPPLVDPRLTTPATTTPATTPAPAPAISETPRAPAPAPTLTTATSTAAPGHEDQHQAAPQQNHDTQRSSTGHGRDD